MLRNSDQFNDFSVAMKKSVDNDLRDFRLSGIALDADKRERYRVISNKDG